LSRDNNSNPEDSVSTEPKFPKPVKIGGVNKWDRFDIANHQRRLAGLPLLERAADARPRFNLSPRDVAGNYGVSTRTLRRGVRR